VLATAAALVATAAPAHGAAKSPGHFPETLPALHAEPDPDDRGRIVDARGREVLLRGVNVNVMADMWQGTRLPTVQPFRPKDLSLLRGMGWNLVRLQLSWSRVEPQPGQYDEAYLAEAERYVETFKAAGMYTIIDMHQDAWGASLAARPGESCPPAFTAAVGWDGAPAWATLAPDDAPRCFALGAKEVNAAVDAAWNAFWRDAPGPDTFGIRTRYASMLGHVARRLSRNDAVAGYDVINEPAAFVPETQAALGDLYGAALREIRAGERLAGAPPRLFLFQPDARASTIGHGVPRDFPRDRDVVYAPHVYATNRPIVRSGFQVARTEARTFGGAPVLIGEWGTDPDRKAAYFSQHQDLQDTFGMSSALWAWSEGCGSPRRISALIAGEAPKVWGLLDVDCVTGERIGPRKALVRRLTRAYVRAAPGRLHGQRYVAKTGRLSAVGTAPDDNEQTLLVFYPGAKHPNSRFRATGLSELRAVRTPGEGRFVVGVPRGPWSLEIGPGVG
jgi:endoglycosylceramidase